ncbi:hypothetical protein DFJ74DRAFT_699635 [Hyaloraphidium curvatum]|nr:hypothetical protein DFJ74DRAFT_699635 [Hyaloraphidium curvatum]
MLRGRSFAKKTRTGQVVNVVREHYLRDDIPCSIRGCPACAVQEATLTEPMGVEATAPQGLYLLVPDTNVFLHQIDVIEHPSFKDVIVLQTVLEEVRHRAIAIYERVRALLGTPSRRFYLFSNEHHKATFAEKVENESPNDRNDRAIRKAAKWYDEHVEFNLGSGFPWRVALLSDDVENRRRAADEGLLAFSVRDFVEMVPGNPELHDMIASRAKDVDTMRTHADALYPEVGLAAVSVAWLTSRAAQHQSSLQVSAGLKDGRFLVGVFNVSSYDVTQGSVFGLVDGAEQQILIQGRVNQNRAIQGDTVAVEILAKSEWGPVKDDIEDDPNSLAGSSGGASGVTQIFDPADDPAGLPSTTASAPRGRIVGILKRSWRLLCGIVDVASAERAVDGSPQNVMFLPVDRRIPRVKFRTRHARSLLGKRIVVAVDSWLRTSRYPTGHYVRTVGDIGDRDAETEVILLENDVAFAPFSAQVLRCLPPEGDLFAIPPQELESRTDLRHLDVCSIDPPGCTDIDDALHCRELASGLFEVGVHIADVGYFVRTGTAMDEEASRRGTTVYLVDKRIDMLPTLLGSNLCSLRSDVDRLAFSCIWEMTESGEVLSTRYAKSVIRSRASLTYEEAQARIDDDRKKDPITTSIRRLNLIAKQLRQERISRGALTLASPEVRFQLENESQDPLDVELKELKETNALVEEFMLLANISVAKQIFQHFPDSSLLRRHPAPSPASFDSLDKALAPLNIKLRYDSSKSLAESLDEAQVPGDPYFNKLLRIMTTRCMMQAVYFCSGKLPENEFRHYGLASDIYTHFTSPIRRYADVVVHRLLHASIDNGAYVPASLIDKGRIDELCANLNLRHRMAQKASRSSVELYTQLYFRGKRFEEDGYVIRVMKTGFVVLVPRFGIEGIVHVSRAAGEPSTLVYDEDEQVLRQDEVIIRVFSKVVVQITVEEMGQQSSRSKLVLKLLNPYIASLSPEPCHAGMKRKEIGAS